VNYFWIAKTGIQLNKAESHSKDNSTGSKYVGLKFAITNLFSEEATFVRQRMKTSISRLNSCTIVSLEGDVDKNDFMQSQNLFALCLKQNKNCLLDMKKVTSLSYSTADFIGHLYKHFTDEGVELAISGISMQPESIFRFRHYYLWILAYKTVDAYLSRGDHTSKYFVSVY